MTASIKAAADSAWLSLKQISNDSITIALPLLWCSFLATTLHLPPSEVARLKKTRKLLLQPSVVKAELLPCPKTSNKYNRYPAVTLPSYGAKLSPMLPADCFHGVRMSNAEPCYR